MIKVSVVGASGYSGVNILHALSMRNDAAISYITSQSNDGKMLCDVFPAFSKSEVKSLNNEFSVPVSPLSTLKFTLYDEVLIGDNSDIVFFCLPHGESSKLVPRLLKTNPNIKIIDVGADFRFDDIGTYEKHYCLHESKDLNDRFIYGLADIFEDKIKNAQFVANPGCYPTGALLPLLPLFYNDAVDTDTAVIIDSLSGISGAGRGLKFQNLFCESENSAKAYNIWSHRHLPEIKEKIDSANNNIKKPKVIFTPHIIPVSRGILTTIYLKLKDGITEKTLKNIYSDYYSNSPFVSILDSSSNIDIKNVIYSNNCHIAFEKGKEESDERFLKIISAIDNLGKGAALQAVQNMNLMFGLKPEFGIGYFTPYP